MPSDYTNLLNRLDNLINTSPGTYRAQCPSHEGRSRSLAIKEADDRLLLHCFAGCSVHEILGAVGLTVGDLFDRPLERTPAERKDRIQTRNSKQTLESIAIPVQAVMQGARIAQHRVFTREENEAFERVCTTVEQALGQAINEGVIHVE